MKKIFALLLVLVALLAVFTGCLDSYVEQVLPGTFDEDEKKEDPKADDKKEDTADLLESAKKYLYQMYKDEAVKTPADYKVVAKVMIDGKTFDITWSLVLPAGKEDQVQIGATEKSMVTIDVADQPAEDVAYTLVATISDGEKTVTVEFSHVLPAYHVAGFDEFVATADDEAVVVSGIVSAVLSKTNGNTTNGLYVQGDKGGYYVYNMTDDPVTLGIKMGQTVKVTGTKDTFNGTYEIASATVEVTDATEKAVTPVDFTEIFANAESVKDEALVYPQSMLVTIKGVEIAGIGSDSTYYTFKLGDLTSYVRISSSACPIVKEQATFISEYNDHIGYIANVTGIVTIYNGTFYLTPATVDAYEYISLPEKSDADAVAFEKEKLTVTDEFIAEGEADLLAKGAAYDKVSIAWAFDQEYAFASIAEGKLIITLPESETTIKLTATLTCGEIIDTKEFEVKVAAATKDYKDVAFAIETATALEDNAYSENYYFKGVVGEIYNESYFDFYLVDGEQSIVVYGLWQDQVDAAHRYGSKYTGLPDFATGDTIYLYANLCKYVNTKTVVTTLEITNALLLSVEKKVYTDAEKVAAEKDSLTLTAEIVAAGDIELAAKGSAHEDVAIAWALDQEYAFAAISEGKLAVTLPESETTVKLIATLTCGEESDTKEFDVKVSAAAKDYKDVAFAIETATALEDNATSANYYFKGVVGEIYNESYFDFYLVDGEQSIVVYGLWQDQVDTEHRYGSKYTGLPDFATGDTIYLYANLCKYVNTKTVVTTLEITDALLLSVEKKVYTDAEKVAAEKDALTFSSSISAAGEINVALVGNTFSDVTIAWASDNAQIIGVDGGKLTVVLPTVQTEVTLTATLTCGEVTDTKAFTVSVDAEGEGPIVEIAKLALTRSSLFTGISSTSYADYNGDHTVGTYTVTTSSVLGNVQGTAKETKDKVNLLQFKKGNAGSLTVTGKFASMKLVVYGSSNTLSNAFSVYVGETLQTIDWTAATATATEIDNNTGCYFFTVIIPLDEKTESTVKVVNSSSNARYFSEINFY